MINNNPYFLTEMKIQIKSVLTAIVVVIMVATGLSLSAAAILDNGKKDVKKNNRLTTYYFQYSGTNTESQYEDANNWLYLSDTDVAIDPCPGLNNIVCVIKADFATQPTTEDLANFLAGLETSEVDGAMNYCTNSTNIRHKKP